MSIRREIRDEIIARLNDDPPSGVPQASKRRWFPGFPLMSTRLSVFFIEEPVETLGGKAAGPIAKRNLAVGIQAACAVEDPADADDALEPVLEWVNEVLGETTLDGKVWSCTERVTAWDAIAADRLYCQAVVIYDITYQTRRNDLTSAQ